MDKLTRLLTNKKELSESEVIQKIRWAQALEACEQYHNELLECKKTTVFGICNKESSLFWDCMDAAMVTGKRSQSAKKSS